MNLATLKAITRDLSKALTGQRIYRTYSMGRDEKIIDLHLPDSRYLFISVDPADPRIYLVRRKKRDIERGSVQFNSFDQTLNAELANASVVGVDAAETERVLTIELSNDAEIAGRLIVQLTGRSANFFLTDAGGRILLRLRNTKGDGQETDTMYSPPSRSDRNAPQNEGEVISHAGFPSLSDALDAQSIRNAEARRSDLMVRAALSGVSREIARERRLLEHLENDLRSHGDGNVWKKYGDLLLAGTGSARRDGGHFVVVDLYDESLPEIRIEAEPNMDAARTAEGYFKRYSKWRRASAEIGTRIEAAKGKLAELEEKKTSIERAAAEQDIETLHRYIPQSGTKPVAQKKRPVETAKETARKFISTDGYEILVGKRAKDNDELTFKTARSFDLWLHAADYPGSHVIIRNPGKGEVPGTTLVEAARLAAFYSQGNKQTKAAVNYTQRKFVNKRKGFAPGLVSLSRFKTILVEPTIPAEIDKKGGQ